MELNLDQTAFFQDPHPFYARIRASGEPFWLPHRQPTTSPGLWLFSRYADALTVFREISAISKDIRRIRPQGFESIFDFHMLHRDGEDHLRLRRLVADYFSGSAMTRLESRVGQIAEELIGHFDRSRPLDLMAEFAELLPLRVICELLGVPEQDIPQIRAWGLLMGDGFDSVSADELRLTNQKQALTTFLAYVERLLEQKAADPDAGLLSVLAKAQAEGNIGREEVLAMAGFLLFAGHETTINLIGNGLWLLLSHPEQWARLQAVPQLLPNAVEEVLRFESPEQRTSFRIVVEPVDLAGIRFEPGQQVGVIIGAVNRDPAEFPDPDRFDITRSPNRHLAFGLGIHQCLGKQMARMEARVALGKILDLCPGLRLLEGPARWRRNSFFRGLHALPALLANS